MASLLLPHVHAARIGDDLVLLDVRADRYLCVPEGVRSLRPDVTLRRLAPTEQAVTLELERMGLTTAAPADGRLRHTPPDPPPKPTIGLSTSTRSRLSTPELVRLLAAHLDLIGCYLGRPLGPILSAASRAPRRKRKTTGPDEALRLAGVFRDAAIWLPVSSKCLVRSFLLLRFLQRSGCSAQWVLAVRTFPFAAHCWLQVGDVVLDDYPERLAPYQPILVVQG